MNYSSTRKQGDAGLGRAISYFTRNGYTVAIPLTDSQDYDLIVEIDGHLKKVQVKTGTMFLGKKKDIPVVYAVTNGGNQTGKGKSKLIPDQHWDLLFCWHIVADVTYLIPKEEITSKNQINLGKTYAKFEVH